MGTGYYHGDWFCAGCWNAWRTQNRRHAHEGRYDERQNNRDDDPLDNLVTEEAPLLLFMMRTLWQRLDQLALQQEEMQRTLMQDLGVAWGTQNRQGRGGWHAEPQNNWNID